jgi:hypothetical protein
MQLEELQRQWQQLDQKLERSLALETELVRQLVVQPARRRVNRLAIGPAIDVALLCAGLVIVGLFLAGHWPDWRLVFPALVLMGCMAALLINNIRQLQIVAELDWSGPVGAIQTALNQVQVEKIRQFKWIILLSPMVWFCGFVVGVHWLLEWLSGGRANIIDKLHPGWVAGNYVFGILFVPAGYFAARALGAWGRRRGWWQSVLDGISDKSLKAATADVERWARMAGGNGE